MGKKACNIAIFLSVILMNMNIFKMFSKKHICQQYLQHSPHQQAQEYQKHENINKYSVLVQPWWNIHTWNIAAVCNVLAYYWHTGEHPEWHLFYWIDHQLVVGRERSEEESSEQTTV